MKQMEILYIIENNIVRFKDGRYYVGEFEIYEYTNEAYFPGCSRDIYDIVKLYGKEIRLSETETAEIFQALDAKIERQQDEYLKGKL